jgi:DNA-binding beta-propeller fold protein YncE
MKIVTLFDTGRGCGQPRSVCAGRGSDFDTAFVCVTDAHTSHGPAQQPPRVLQISLSDGKLIRTIGSSDTTDAARMYSIAAVHYSKCGKIYVSDVGDSDVVVFDKHGALLHRFMRDTATTVSETDRDTKSNDILTMRMPRGVAVSSSGYVAVCDSGNHRISIFDSNGCFVRVFGEWGYGPGQLRCPFDCAFDNNDNLVVADMLNNRIQVFSIETGHSILQTNGSLLHPLVNPKSVCTTRDNYIVVADSGNARIQVLDSHGTGVAVHSHVVIGIPVCIDVTSNGLLLVQSFTKTNSECHRIHVVRGILHNT